MNFEGIFIYIVVIFAVINLLAFFIMLSDKAKSGRTGTERISEGMMFFMAAAFGSLGIYAGMFACRHKTHKLHFLLSIPLLFIENIATLYVLYLWLTPYTSYVSY